MMAAPSRRLASKVDPSAPADPKTLFDRVTQAACEVVARTAPSPTREECAALSGVPLEDVHRMFADDTALHVAMIEHFVVQLMDSVVRAVVQVPSDDPLEQHRAATRAYLDWAFQNPAGMMVFCGPSMIVVADADRLHQFSQSMYVMTTQFLQRAIDAGQNRDCCTLDEIQLMMRNVTLGSGLLETLGQTGMWGTHADTKASHYAALDAVYRLIRA